VRNKFKQVKTLLQMPPVVKVLEDDCKVLSNDPALLNFSQETHVFTDITYGLRNEDRLVVVRERNGVLHEAPFHIKKRVWQIYFPMKGRRFIEPKIFDADNMKRLLEAHEYEFILDRLLLQFEPYEPKYHQITSQVYLHINDHLQFETLRSTRHFGPMAFAFAWHKMIDNLLLDMIRNDYLKNGVELICLMYKLNDIKEPMDILKQLHTEDQWEAQIKSTLQGLYSRDESLIKKIDKSELDLKIDEICFEFIQNYVKKYSAKKPQLELVLQTYQEFHNEIISIAKGFEKKINA
jgi:small subunit ribosomal protein S22